MSDETLSDVAPEGQPTDEAVADAPVVDETPSPEPAAAAPDPGQPASRLYAGKYTSAEELERSYLESQREASRMAGELSALRKQTPATPTSTEPAWKEMEKNRYLWSQEARRTDITDERRAQCYEQVALHTEEIATAKAFAKVQEHATKQTATQALEAEALEFINEYRADLTPDSKLFQIAQQYYAQAVNAGYPKTNSLEADAVRYAVMKTGHVKAKAVAGDRKEFLGHLNKQARAAVKAGAGTATPTQAGGVTAAQIEGMSPSEFAKFKRELQLGV